jgi:hypothetical protein
LPVSVVTSALGLPVKVYRIRPAPDASPTGTIDP